MSFKAMAWASNQKLPAMQKIVLLMLANRADENGVCFPSHELIAEDCGMGRSTAIRQIDSLEVDGYLKVVRAKKGSHQVNKYILSLEFTSVRAGLVQVSERDTVCVRAGLVQVSERDTKLSMKQSSKHSLDAFSVSLIVTKSNGSAFSASNLIALKII